MASLPFYNNFKEKSNFFELVVINDVETLENKLKDYQEKRNYIFRG